MRLAIILLLATMNAHAAEKPSRIVTDRYSAEAPSPWRIDDDRHGQWFVRMPEKDAAAASIGVEFITPTETGPKDAADYVARKLKVDDLFGVASGYSREKKDVVVAGQKCAVLTRTAPSMNRHGERPMMVSVVIAVPAKKGFFVISLDGPENRKAGDRKAFDAVVKSFKPAL